MVKGAHIITESIQVGVPVDVAFDEWGRYDKWHQMFKKESASTRRGKDSDKGSQGSGDGGDQAAGDISVTAKIGPSTRRWSAEVTKTDPPHRLEWRPKGGLQAKGVTSFHSLDERLTKVMVEIEYRPSGLFETVGNFFRMQRRRVRRDLRLFKNYVELRPDQNTEQGRPGDREQHGRRREETGDEDRSSRPADREEAR